MRIIAGAKRGMKLLSPKTDVSRPITDRVKESLFDVLWNYGFLEGKIAADLFCGVGSLGLEALSRGAEFVAFVEKDLKIVATLKKNVEKAGFAGESKVVRANAFKIGAPAYKRKYDLIFVDPPYAASRETKDDAPLGKLLVLLTEQLSPDGIVVVRTEKRIELLEQYGGLKVIERRQWGTMVVTILHRSSK
ncbi:MAG: 16S rRNA (guanine(966)-N(2))-methyltransferase RsmD [Phycisphaerae bacterium]|nr:16S rRNA (guanine(966)-N(2))-methyltransferase RsmD [Phycisphaerae bacterium]MDD5381227.1 16S rRNA (guanine(966)-N(2))-methyltransferase RsmD [Phycisphaerae bacterium]